MFLVNFKEFSVRVMTLIVGFVNFEFVFVQQKQTREIQLKLQ